MRILSVEELETKLALYSRKELGMYQVFVFDLYGTLVDIHTDEEAREVWEKLALFYGYYGAVYTPEELKIMYWQQTEALRKHGSKQDSHESFPEIQIEHIFSELYQNKGIKVSGDLAIYTGQFFRALSTEYVRLYEGAKALLESLKASGGKLYLLSNAQRIFAEYEMKALGIWELFDGIYISSDYAWKKPDRRFFQTLIENEKIKPETAIMIGNDGVCDIEGAKKVGMDTLYIHSNLSPEEELPDADFVFKILDQEQIADRLLEKRQGENVRIRAYQETDQMILADLFYQTVHTINTKDYSEEQVDVWAPEKRDMKVWNDSFLQHDSVVAEICGKIVGFGDMDEKGYLDRLYVHKDFQRKGIATAICEKLEGRSEATGFETHASITAKAFFEARGYEVKKEQQVERNGVFLKNYIMRKRNG